MTTPAKADDLTAWLRAQLDDDERIARAVADHRQRRGEFHWEEVDPESRPGLIGDRCGNPVTLGEPHGTAGWRATHIARHDPARVLAEVDAKRRILDLHTGEHECADWKTGVYPDDWPADASWGKAGERWSHQTVEHFEADEPCHTQRLLALPYADHPDYREEWRP